MKNSHRFPYCSPSMATYTGDNNAQMQLPTTNSPSSSSERYPLFGKLYFFLVAWGIFLPIVVVLFNNFYVDEDGNHNLQSTWFQVLLLVCSGLTFLTVVLFTPKKFVFGTRAMQIVNIMGICIKSIDYGTIESIQSGGAYYGFRWSFSTAIGTKLTVTIVRKGLNIVITPKDPEEFVRKLNEYIQPTSEYSQMVEAI